MKLTNMVLGTALALGIGAAAQAEELPENCETSLSPNYITRTCTKNLSNGYLAYDNAVDTPTLGKAFHECAVRLYNFEDTDEQRQPQFWFIDKRCNGKVDSVRIREGKILPNGPFINLHRENLTDFNKAQVDAIYRELKKELGVKD